MKKIFLFLLLFCFSNVKAAELTKYSSSAVLIEPTTQKIIYEQNKDEKRPPASMTKLMTMLITMEAIHEGRINLDDKVLISENSSNMGGSQIFLETGMEIEVQQLLKGIAIASGNDAAVAMAEHIAGSVDVFVEMMNEKAAELGLSNTHFVNVHGLDAENHYSTANDMAIIAVNLLKYPDILSYTSLYEDYLVKPDGSKTWLVNTNKLVRFYPGVDGLKTGYTSSAGYCLTATAKKDDIRFISVVMGVDSSEHRSADTTSLLNYAFSNYKLNTILTTNDIVGQLKIKKGKKSKVDIIPLDNITDLVKKSEQKDYSYEIDYTNNTAPLLKGDIVGSIDVIDNNGNLVKTVSLTVKEDVYKHSFGSLFIKCLKRIINGY